MWGLLIAHVTPSSFPLGCSCVGKLILCWGFSKHVNYDHLEGVLTLG